MSVKKRRKEKRRKKHNRSSAGGLIRYNCFKNLKADKIIVLIKLILFLIVIRLSSIDEPGR